jgi:hypothetical protein
MVLGEVLSAQALVGTWPSRSPDLTPLDIFMGNSKGHCVADVPTTPDNMRQCIID